MKRLLFNSVNIGTEIPVLTHRVSLIDMIKYTSATWNFFLLHLSKEFAQKQGFRDANIHGPLYGAFLARMMTDWIGDPGRLKKLSYQVRIMGFPEDTLTCKGRVIKKYQEAGLNLVDCDIWVENQKGEKLSNGAATASLPG